MQPRGSRAATHALCVAIRPEHRWEIGEHGQPLKEAAVRARTVADDPTLLDGEVLALTQRRIGSAIRKRIIQSWRETGTPTDRTINNAYSAKGAGKLLELTPSMTLDMKLASSEFSTNVAGILGAMSWKRALHAVCVV